MEIACLDLEGVLVPEIWIAFAEKTGIESLKATTRDIPDYDVLMKQRLRILDEHGLKLADIQEVIATLKPLDGAVEFVDWLRERFQVVILSDTFYEFSQPLMRQLGFPTLLCHRLTTDETDRVVDYQLRQKDPKRQSVIALKSPQAAHTALTTLFSGRPARGIVNRIMRELGPLPEGVPPFPLAGNAIGALRAQTEKQGLDHCTPLWAGQNASGCREIPAGQLTRELAAGWRA